MAAAGGHWLKIAQGDVGKLVFVPAGQTAGQAITGRKPAGGGFPGSPDDTQTIKGLGGSTGAKLVQDGSGNLYVKKYGNSAEHLTQEAAADSVYQALGMNVPAHQVYQTAKGPVKLAKFADGQTLDKVEANNPNLAAKAAAEVRKGFAADALLDNWDVIGLGKDNILIGKNGKVYRIDNGGSLQYRAQGKLKGTDGTEPFTSYPNAVFSLRAKGTAGSVFGSLTASDVAKQIGPLVAKRQAILKALPKSLQGIVGARLDRMRQYANIHKALSLKGYSDKSIDNFTRKLWAGLQSGGVKIDPKSQADIFKAFEMLGG